MECLAVAYDTPIPGYGTKNCANIRLWSAKPVQGFDLNSFNAGNYEASVHASSEVGNIVSPSSIPSRPCKRDDGGKGGQRMVGGRQMTIRLWKCGFMCGQTGGVA